ncbi:signal peptidase II, partial [Candidatus Woesearchaeota archaeon]|nr:signal peptidase II [Candidatus Woesearchaeota archaeon]
AAYAKTGVALILAGTTGNIIDRLLLGYVTDFIAFSFWPAFNIADSALTIGTGLMILYFARTPQTRPSP